MNKLFIINKKGLWISCVLLSSFVLVFNITIMKKNDKIPGQGFLTLDSFPETLGDWTAGPELGLDIRSLDVLRLSSYVKRTYTNSEGRRVFLYIGYWASQTGEHQAAKHSPVLCLPSNGWLTSSRENYEFTFPTGETEADISMRRILGEKRGLVTLFYYWFFTGKEYYYQEWYALIKLSLHNLLYGRNDGGIIEIAAELPRDRSQSEAETEANEIIQDFLKELVPYFHSRIRKGS